MTVPNIHFQPRDFRILPVIAEVGLLDMNTIAQRYFDGSLRACQRRMRLYVAHDLVHPLFPTVTCTDGRVGRLPTMFRLTARGAEVLATFTGSQPRRPPRRDQRPETLLHSLEVAKVRLAVDDACANQRLAKPQWINELDTYADLALRMKNKKAEKKTLPAVERFILLERFPLPDGRTATCWPDVSCHLSIPGATGQAHSLLIYWEIDRATEVLAQVAAKMFGYQALLTTEAYRKHWPAVTPAAVRIFFVVPSPARLQNVAKVLAKSNASGAVRLTTTADLTPDHFFTQPIWRTVSGECLPILRAPVPAAS